MFDLLPYIKARRLSKKKNSEKWLPNLQAEFIISKRIISFYQYEDTPYWVVRWLAAGKKMTALYLVEEEPYISYFNQYLNQESTEILVTLPPS